MAISIQEARRRFEDAGFQRADRFETGAKGKGSVWAAAKARAKTNFAPAMQEVLSKKLYDTGVDAADATDYDRGITDKGIPNWQTGMQTGGTKWEKRTGKFVSLWNQALPTSGGPKRSASNLKRMAENVQRFITASGK
ncbi:hypothetical protein HY478_00340 [Candidatus Uhrbacteria bacterium]|nr:hypothetical protein [Candidatus Uhrbacteria bacterium]